MSVVALRRLEGHTGAVRKVTFSADGRTALSAADDAAVILWDVETGRELRRLTGHTGAVRDVIFGPDGHTALSGSADETIILWNVDTGTPLRRLRGQSGGAWSVAISPDGQIVFAPELTCAEWGLYMVRPACEENTPTPAF